MNIQLSVSSAIARCLRQRSAVVRFVFAVLLLSLPPALAAGADDAQQIRVLSYNIHHGEGVDGKLDLKRIAGVIRSVDPTVVALQEVDRGTQRTKSVDQPAELARMTGMHVVFEKNIEFGGGQYGNAVLTKLPVTKHRNIHLPSLDNGEQRGVLVVELEVAKQSLLFLGTHLDHRRKQRERLASVKTINELVAQYGSTPAILAGDMNATHDSAEIKLLQRLWSNASRSEQPTVPVAKPIRQIDFVMVRPQERWRVIESRVLDESVASDHRAIFAVLELVPLPE